MSLAVSRRSFLVAAGALVVAARAARASPSAAAEPGPEPLNAFVAVTPEDEVIVYSPSSEMGQGITTTLALVVAEELDARWDQVRVEHAPAGRAYRRRLGPGIQQQLTGGSTSTKLWHAPLAEAGAMARARLVAVAAARWGVAASDCTVERGVIQHGAKKLRFGEVAEEAAWARVKPGPTKPPKAWAQRGARVGRLDSRDKVTGAATFGADVRLPGMRYASPVACPVFGGRVAQVDDTAARAVVGVLDVLRFETWVAVVAEHTGAALAGARALSIAWDTSDVPPVDTTSLAQDRRDALDGKLKTLHRGTALDPDQDGVIGGTYEVPYLEHLCMAPLNATAHVTENHCTLWLPTQAQTMVVRAAKKLTGLATSEITVHTTQLGGGFGRRGYTDEARQAVQISQRIGAPVQVQWSREESLRQGRYRPAASCRMLGRIDEGRVIAHARLVRQSEFDFFVPDFVANTGFALKMMSEGLSPMAYAFDDWQLDAGRVSSNVPVGFWRSVGHSSAAFFKEAFMDELAEAAGEDPVAFRLRHLAEHPRQAACLRKAVELAGSAPPGRFHGVAVHESYESICAEVVEIEMQGGWPKVHKVICVLDCGRVLHPDGADAQLMGGVIFGLSAALYGKVDFAEGRAVQSNFHDAPIVRMPESPEVITHFIESDEVPITGVGELSTPPLAPALCNAIFAATGQRIRTLPLVDVLERS